MHKPFIYLHRTSSTATKEQALHRCMSESILPKTTGPRLSLSSANLDLDEDYITIKKTVSQKFTNYLKTEGWSKQRLHKLHVVILVLTFFMYVCHIISVPPFQVLGNEMIIIFKVVQLFLLVIGVVCWLTMCYVNGSGVVTIRMFQKKCANIHLLVLADTLFSDRIIEREDSVRFSTGIP